MINFIKSIIKKTEKPSIEVVSTFRQITNSQVNPVSIEKMGNQLLRDFKEGNTFPKASVDVTSGLYNRTRTYNLGRSKVNIIEAKGSYALEIITDKKYLTYNGEKKPLVFRAVGFN